MFEGVLLLDKPEGPTTAACSRRLSRATGRVKIGHAGTLDPIATGLVLVLIGRATKLSVYLSGVDKAYTGRVYLGKTTSTGDSDGEIISESPVAIDEDKLFEISRLLVGRQMQIPPAFSAVKLSGKPLYHYARNGIAAAVPPRAVTVYSFNITGVDLPEFAFEATVSKGTYIRALAEKFGEMAGCGAHLSALRRTRIGRFSVGDAVTLDEAIELARNGELDRYLIGLKDAIEHLTQVEITVEQAVDVSHGREIEIAKPEHVRDGLFALVSDGKLAAIARWSMNGSCYHYERVFVRPNEIEN